MVRLAQLLNNVSQALLSKSTICGSMFALVGLLSDFQQKGVSALWGIVGLGILSERLFNGWMSLMFMHL